MSAYKPSDIESKWQKFWVENKTFKTDDSDFSRPKYYVLDMFPYPSGQGLHVGHPEGYTATDIIARYKRMQGCNVLHPIGWDAFGLPAEQYAVKTGTHPRATTEKNIKRFREQLQAIGFSYDWDREVDTTDPDYFKWTQWIFLQLYKKDLAYEAKMPVNWCPALGTVLANEEVIDGKSEVGGFPVERRPMRQWMLKITAYADRLLDDLEDVDWPESIKEMQRNWIGKSVGANVKFEIVGGASPGPSKGGEIDFNKPELLPGEEERKSRGGEYTKPGFATADPEFYAALQQKAEEYRNNPTTAEKVLWQELRNSKTGFKIRRQHPVLRFIPDFICLKKRVIIEADGEIHNSREHKEYDQARTEELKKLDFKVLRFSNQEILNNTDQVITKIQSELKDRKDYPRLDVENLSNKADTSSPPLEWLGEAPVEVFTTRPDTLFGATYMVLAPEHPLVDKITTSEQELSVKAYQKKAALKSDLDRTDLAKDKTGEFTGAYAINPVTGKPIPIWIADYVMMSYGTGAIMAVPGHDQRDWEFAKKFDLPIVEVVSGGDVSKEAYSGDGEIINSSNDDISINGLNVEKAIAKIIDWLEENNLGKKAITYKLRDWLFSRQRYWGEPIPVIHVDGKHKAIPESDLPLTLPVVDKYDPSGTGESPLARIEEWVNTTDPETGKSAKRETNTMPQWAGSCWYYLRYIDPDYTSGPVNPEKEKYWMPVDLYVGGAEHAVLHLLYARFWHKVLYDIGVVSTKEPFHRLVNQGMILGEMEYTVFKDADGNFVNANEREDGVEYKAEKLKEQDIEKKGAHFVLKGTDVILDARSFKMSKSRGNVINPDDVISEYGADALRLYEMFMGPLEQVKPWSMQGVDGVYRFLARVWRMMVDEDSGELLPEVQDVAPTKDQLKVLHHTIKKVTEDIDGHRFNTGISAMMIFNNEAIKWDIKPVSVLKDFVLLLSPYAPHIAEELWEKLGGESTLAYHEWPKFDEQYLLSETKKYAVQVNGKVRGQIEVPADKATNKDYVLSEAKREEGVKKYLDEGNLVKEIFVPNRIINFVVK